MEVIVGGRQTGKTKYLVDMLREDRRRILIVVNEQERRRILQNYGLPAGQVVTSQMLMEGINHYNSGHEFLIDDLDILLPIMFGGPVKSVSATGMLTRMVGGQHDPRTGV